MAFFILNPCAFGSPGKTSNQGSDDSFALMQREIDKKKDLLHRKFQDYLPFIKEDPIIPGLFQGVVPQGKAFLPEHDLIVISNYMSIERTAALETERPVCSPTELECSRPYSSSRYLSQALSFFAIASLTLFEIFFTLLP